MAHIPQNETAIQSPQTDPCMPPRVRIRALNAIRPPGTNHGIHIHSPVRDDTLQIAHGRQQYVMINELQSEQHDIRPESQSL